MTLTADTGRLLSKLHQVQPKGEVQFMSGVRIAHVSRPTRKLSSCVILFYGIVFCNNYFKLITSLTSVFDLFAACLEASTGQEPQDAHRCVHCKSHPGGREGGELARSPLKLHSTKIRTKF